MGPSRVPRVHLCVASRLNMAVNTGCSSVTFRHNRPHSWVHTSLQINTACFSASRHKQPICSTQPAQNSKQCHGARRCRPHMSSLNDINRFVSVMETQCRELVLECDYVYFGRTLSTIRSSSAYFLLNSCLCYSWNLKIERVCSPETSV